MSNNQQYFAGVHFEHSTASALNGQLGPVASVCPTFSKHQSIFQALPAPARNKLLHQSALLVHTLIHSPDFLKKGYAGALDLKMLGSEHGKKGNPADIQMQFTQGGRLDISCKHQSKEMKGMRVRHNRQGQHLHIHTMDFLLHAGSAWQKNVNTLLLPWLKKNSGKDFSLLSQKHDYYTLITQALQSDLKNYLMPTIPGTPHSAVQKDAICQMLQFFAGTNSYFLLHKVNDSMGYIQKVDTLAYCQKILLDQVHIASIENSWAPSKDQSEMENYVTITFSDTFKIWMRIKNGNRCVSPSAFKFSVSFENKDILWSTTTVKF